MYVPLETLTQVNVDNAVDSNRLLAAQCGAVARIHQYMVIQPSAFITDKINKEFLLVFLEKRAKLMTLRGWSLLAFVPVAPVLLSFAMKPTMCNIFGERVLGDELGDEDVHEGDVARCHFSASMISKELLAQYATEQIVLQLILHVVTRLLYLCRPSQRWLMWALVQIRQYMPGIFLNVMGPAESNTSIAKIFLRHGANYRAVFFHDYLGTLSLTNIAFVTILAIFISLVRASWQWGELQGVSLLFSFGAPILGYVAPTINFCFGGSSEMKEVITSELRSHQPMRKYLRRDASQRWELNVSALEEEVRKAEQELENALLGSNLSPEITEGIRSIKTAIHENGKEVLEKMAKWAFKKYKIELSGTSHSCLFLWEAKTTWYCNEYDVAAVAIMDLPGILFHYFDPEFKHLRFLRMGTGIKFCGRQQTMGWSNRFILNQVIIANPDRKVCGQQKDGTWRIQDAKKLFLQTN